MEFSSADFLIKNQLVVIFIERIREMHHWSFALKLSWKVQEFYRNIAGWCKNVDEYTLLTASNHNNVCTATRLRR